MALPTDFPIVYPLPTKTGIVVGIVPGDPSFEIELQRAPQSSGAPGTPVTIARLAPFPATGSFYRDLLPIDGAVYYYRYRHVRTGWTASAYSPWTRAATAQDMPIIVPVPLPSLESGSVTPDMVGDDGIVALGPNGRLQLAFNADFELGLGYWTAVDSSLSPGWQSILANDPVFNAQMNTATPYQGTQSFQITTPSGSPTHSCAVFQTRRASNDLGDARPLYFRVEDDFTFFCQLAVKCSAAGGAAAIRAWCFDGSGSALGGKLIMNQFFTTTSYALYSGSGVGLFSGTKYVALSFIGVADSATSFTYSFDNVNVWRQSRSTDLANASVTSAKLDIGYYNNGTKATNFTIDWVNGDHQRVTLGATPLTITLTNPVSGKRYILDLVQDGTGSRTVVWPGAVKWPGGTAPTLTTTINRVDQIELFYNGTSTDYRGTFTLDFVD